MCFFLLLKTLNEKFENSSNCFLKTSSIFMQVSRWKPVNIIGPGRFSRSHKSFGIVSSARLGFLSSFFLWTKVVRKKIFLCGCVSKENWLRITMVGMLS